MLEEKSTFRVIVDNQNSAKVNMSVDAALIKNFNYGDNPILRLYYWNKSYTIGISQDIKDYLYLDNYSKDYAKRVTGGGVLFHGHDLSYSLVIPSSYFNTYKIKQSYEKICSFLLRFYEKLGLKPMFAKDDEFIKLSKNEFCQVGFEAYDILVNHQKIGGNAQRRTKKVLFQHGSIPLYSVKNSNILFEKAGISLEDININITYEEAIKFLIASFEESFNVEIIKSKMNDNEKELRDNLLKEKQ